MFLVINIWGSRNRKYKASYMFFLYTLIGSIFMLVAIFYIFVTKGTTNLDILLIQPFSFSEQLYLWVAIFIAMAVKIPIFPFHSWLPEAHVEAPTSGSVLLAGVLLKLGGYGIIRFILPLLPDASIYFSTFITAICLSSIIYSSFCALRQNDLKRIIAYASIAHMNLIVLGLFSCNLYGIQGSIFQMISHGLVSGLLFICIGMLYDRSKTRLVASYSGLVNSMPLFVVVFFVASIANMAFPFTCSFIGEFSVFFGIFISNAFVGMLSTSGMFLCGTYSIWLLNRISFGNSLNINLINKDLTEHEVIISLLLIIPIIFLGLQPNYILAGFATISSGSGLLVAL
jgi:proton-translocating NADH-quinone oxidoreductase chain M